MGGWNALAVPERAARNARKTAISLTLVLILSLTLIGCTATDPAETTPPGDTAPSADITLPGGTDADNIPGTPESTPLSSREFSFLFFSDTQADPETGDYSETGELLARAAAQTDNIGLVVFGGDTVNDGGDADEWLRFHQAAGPALEGLTTAAIPGNHDNYPLLAGQFDYPANAPGRPGEGWFYSFVMGPVFFVMLDSNIMGAANEADIEWLRNTLQSADAQQAAWRVVVMHHPMWPAASIPKDAERAETMREHFLPVMEDYRVDLILCGHQHSYARGAPMSGDSTASQDSGGIVQVMVASGGKGAYTVEDSDYIAISANAPNYLLVTADYESLSAVAYDASGTIIDSFSVLPGEALQ